MIVQRVPDGISPIVIRNVDHARAAAQIARAFGGGPFLMPEPVDLTWFAIENHEEGWRTIDDHPRRNPATGLPYHLVETPQDLLLAKSVASPDFAERHHPWCGLLVSMHCWGLYHRRYGLSEAISIAGAPSEHSAAVETMLAGERGRQQRLKALLRADLRSAPWVENEALFPCYKLFEFCDTLALWWHATHYALRVPVAFAHVPGADGTDIAVGVVPTGPHTARVSPYPFWPPAVELRCEMRAVHPAMEDAGFARRLAASQWREDRLLLTP